MNTSPSNHQRHQLHIWQIADSWRHLPQEVINRLPKQLKADISGRVGKSAESRQAESRIEDMATVANRQHKSSTKQATKIIVAVVGAMTFSAGTQVLTSRLGAAALPAAMVGGAMASYLVDDRTTKVITKMRIAHSTQQELLAIKRQQESHPPVNELGTLFYSTQMGLVEQIEGKNLQKQLAVDGILAGLLSAGEFATALWIVLQLGLPGGILIEAIAASLPVSLIWIAAAYQSDHFELPEHYADLIKKYLPYLFPPEGMSETEEMELLADKEAQEIRLDWLVKYVAQGDASRRLKNLAMAEADFDIKAAQKRKQQLEQERDRAVEQRLFQHRAEVADLPNQFPLPEIDMTGAPEEIKERQQRVERLRVQWVQQKTAELGEIVSQDVKMIAHRYATMIQQSEEDAAAAQKRYDEAYRNWRGDNQEIGGDLGDAA